MSTSEQHAPAPSSTEGSEPLGTLREHDLLVLFRSALDNVTHCVSLKDAQAVAAQALAQAWRLNDPAAIEAECRSVLNSGARNAYIDSIKTHRTLTGSTLKAAKDYIDALGVSA